MTITLIAPLRKTSLDGKPYTRPKNIEAKLVEIDGFTRDKIVALSAIEQEDSPEYLPSECLVHLVRKHRSEPFDEFSETIFKMLMKRVLQNLPQADSFFEDKECVRKSNVRDEARSRFLEMLMKDRLESVEALDIYEVRFEMALKALRVDAKRKLDRKENSLETIETDSGTGEIAEKVERAAGMFDPLDGHPLDNPNYLLRLNKAIDGLQPLQKAIVEMIRKGIPIESKEAEFVNISKTLGKTPKTIRTHRDLAFATLKSELTNAE